ncbi:vicilin-like seed storage protein At2g28490 [Tasmannia lanceolata]|uniref:vicilin-like seed storage protein At2g28490 n=1 Tax=Tasmannia lanceolata TaxID=3420 RepID=UPI00406360EA
MGSSIMHKFLILFLIFSIPMILVNGYEEEEEEHHHGGGGGGGERRGKIFMLEHSKQVVKTEGGEVRILKGYRGRGIGTPMHIGFILMEPNTLYIPQYIDSSLILFVRRGEMRIGWIYEDKLVEKDLKTGDIYRIPAGSAFYMVNIGKGQRLQIICSVDTSESLGDDTFQAFYIGGGTYPTPVLAGFEMRTLTTAFNVSTDELATILGRQKGGPIVFMRGSESDQKNVWTSLMKLKQKEREEQRQFEEDGEDREQEEVKEWTWRKFLRSFIGKENKRRESGVGYPDSYNLYDRSPDFKNNYGWSLAIDENDYKPLRHSGIGVYYVNLTAGSMMAPHVNPTATEYGVVLSGVGTIQVVFPNGSLAMNTEVHEGDAFWIPRYFPFCQIASRSGAFEFFGFTTSSRTNRPQFLAGASSVLRTMSGPEMAAAFDVSLERYRKFVEAQRESIILPAWPETPDLKGERLRPLIKTVA